MFDDINIKYKDAKTYISVFNSFFIIKKLERKIAKEGATAQDYFFLAKAYDLLFNAKPADKITVLKYLLKSIRADKDYAPAYNYLGCFYLDNNKLNKAEKYLLKAIEKGPEDYYSPLFWISIVYTVNHEWVKAQECMDKIDKISAEEPLYYMAKFVLNSYACYTNSIDLKNYFKMVLSFIKFGRYLMLLDSVLLLFRVIYIRITDSIDIVNLRFLQIDYLNKTGKERKVLENTLKSIRKFKLFRFYFYIELLGYYYWVAEDYKKCINVANRFLMLDKIDLIYDYKALCYEDLGNYDKAIDTLESAKNSIKIRDNFVIRILDKFLHYYIGDVSSIDDLKVRLYFKKGNYKDAIKYANEVLIKKKSLYILRVKAISYYYLGKYNEALLSFHEALKYDVDGENIDNLCYWISYCYYIIENYNKARIYVDIALKEKEDYYNYALKGDILTSLKEYKEADACYKKAYEFDE